MNFFISISIVVRSEKQTNKQFHSIFGDGHRLNEWTSIIIWKFCLFVCSLLFSEKKHGIIINFIHINHYYPIIIDDQFIINDDDDDDE